MAFSSATLKAALAFCSLFGFAPSFAPFAVRGSLFGGVWLALCCAGAIGAIDAICSSWRGALTIGSSKNASAIGVNRSLS
ncbi:MAG: hypothetical protein LBC09_06950 [Helicobacteraceae bacterium]|nr:hypothetical protein [Helicobacteraceae bacterium]